MLFSTFLGSSQNRRKGLESYQQGSTLSMIMYSSD